MIYHSKKSFDQFAFSNSSIIASLSALPPVAHRLCTSSGTKHLPEGFFSQSHLSLCNLAPSDVGGGWESTATRPWGGGGGGAGGPGWAFNPFFSFLRPGLGAGILGGGVAKESLEELARACERRLSISFCIFLFA